MEKFRDYNGLAGLRASELTIKGAKKPLPENGRIGDHVKNCEELVCELHSDEIWLFAKYDLCCYNRAKHAAAEFKVNKDCSIGYLRLVLEKLTLNLWSYLHSSRPKYYYVLKDITTKLTKASKANMNDVSFDSPGEVIDYFPKEEKVGAHFDAESVLLIKAEICTLEEELLRNPSYALGKFEGRDDDSGRSQIEPEDDHRDTVMFPSYLNIKQLFSPRSSL